MAAVWDEGSWGCAAPWGAILPLLWHREQSPPRPGARSQCSLACLGLSQHRRPAPTPECLHGATLEHSTITSWETPPRRAGDHLSPGVAPRGTVHPEGKAWICVKFQRKNTFPSNPGSLRFPCGVPALHHSVFSLLLLKMYSWKNTQRSPDLEV